MKTGSMGAIVCAVLSFGVLGCDHLPGKPGFRPETMRPDQTVDFAILYKSNCSACHGDRGSNGAALPLDNPVYLDWAGRDRILQIVANGVPQRLMPAFGKSGGGMLTDRQLQIIVDGMIARWGDHDALNGAHPPAYSAGSKGDAAAGRAAFASYCARCHGADGKGTARRNTANHRSTANQGAATGSIVDPTYLALISSQGLRDIVVSGLPGEGMPDWRGDATGKPMTDKEVTDVVAWMVSQRVRFPGQPFAASAPP